MELSFSCNSLLQLQSELVTSCSGLSEQDYFGSGQGFRGSSDFERFTLLRELNSKYQTCITCLRVLHHLFSFAPWFGQSLPKERNCSCQTSKG